MNDLVYIKKSDIHGWGVFVKEFIYADTIIIQTPGIVLKATQQYPESLTRYFYPYDGDFILGFGYASLINSSPRVNVSFHVNKEDNLIVIKTICDIQPNEEITLNYL